MSLIHAAIDICTSVSSREPFAISSSTFVREGTSLEVVGSNSAPDCFGEVAAPAFSCDLASLALTIAGGDPNPL